MHFRMLFFLVLGVFGQFTPVECFYCFVFLLGFFSHDGGWVFSGVHSPRVFDSRQTDMYGFFNEVYEKFSFHATFPDL